MQHVCRRDVRGDDNQIQVMKGTAPPYAWMIDSRRIETVPCGTHIALTHDPGIVSQHSLLASVHINAYIRTITGSDPRDPGVGD